MTIGFLFAIAACAIGAPAIFGLWSVRHYFGQLDTWEFCIPTVLAVGISLVSAASAIAALEPGIAKEMGGWVRFTDIYAVALIVDGLAIGGLEGHGSKKG